jgi:hypothetical protein
MLIDEAGLIQYIKDDLQAGIVNLEISDEIIGRNLDRALGYSSDFFSYTSYKTLDINATTASGGYINLADIDGANKVPVVIAVYPTTGVINIDSALLGLGSMYVKVGQALDAQLSAYSTMISKVALLESILGRNARVIGDKLYVDKYYSRVTVEYIPEVIAIENINEGAWIRFLVDYTVALCQKQMAQARGKYVIASNPAVTNAAELYEQSVARITALEEELKTKGILITRR